MRPGLFLPILIFLFISGHAFGDTDEPIQMDEIGCAHLSDLNEEEFSFLLAWLDGYFNHMHGTAVLSDQSLANLGQMIQVGCTATPEGIIIDLLNERTRLDALGQHP